MNRGRALRFTEHEYDARSRAPSGFVEVWPRERELMKAVFEALKLHPRVAATWRMNVAKGRLQIGENGASRFMAFGFRGASDLMGFLRGGAQFFACEVKRPGERATADQVAFLDCVRAAGGVGFVAHSVTDVFKYIPVEA